MLIRWQKRKSMSVYTNDNSEQLVSQRAGCGQAACPDFCEERTTARGASTRPQNSLGKSLAKQSMAIIPKIRELDEFLNAHCEYKNVICESHPELCFARLNGEVLSSRKKEFSGFSERVHILSEYLNRENLDGLWNKAKELRCNPDDIADAVCLAVVAGLKAQDMCETVPAAPHTDARGLLMQMIVPVNQ